MLRAKMVALDFDITYDIPPPADLPHYAVSMQDTRSFPRDVGDIWGYIRGEQWGRILPGTYYFRVFQVGYHHVKEKIDILPSEKSLLIHAHLTANRRSLDFNTFDLEANHRIHPYKVMDIGKSKIFSVMDTYQPGEEVHFKIMFERYATQNVSVVPVPGEEPFVVDVPMMRLKPLKFSLRKSKMIQDGIEYPFYFTADGQNIEEHLIKLEVDKNALRYTLMVPPEVKYFTIHAGYMFVDILIERHIPEMMIGRCQSISIPELIIHLEKVSKENKRGIIAGIEIIETMLGSFLKRKMLKQCTPDQREQLVRFLETWNLDTQQNRIEKAIKTISSFKN